MKKNLYIFALILGAAAAAFFYWRSQQEMSQCEHEGHEHGVVEIKDDNNKALLKEVMDIHDEVMPKMSYIASLQQKFRQMAEKTKDKTLKDKYLELSTGLEKADEAMMVWMEKFPENIDQMPTEEAHKVLLSEKEKVTKMKEQVLNAIKASEDFFVENK